MRQQSWTRHDKWLTVVDTKTFAIQVKVRCKLILCMMCVSVCGEAELCVIVSTCLCCITPWSTGFCSLPDKVIWLVSTNCQGLVARGFVKSPMCPLSHTPHNETVRLWYKYPGQPFRKDGVQPQDLVLPGVWFMFSSHGVNWISSHTVDVMINMALNCVSVLFGSINELNSCEHPSTYPHYSLFFPHLCLVSMMVWVRLFDRMSAAQVYPLTALTSQSRTVVLLLCTLSLTNGSLDILKSKRKSFFFFLLFYFPCAVHLFSVLLRSLDFQKKKSCE